MRRYSLVLALLVCAVLIGCPGGGHHEPPGLDHDRMSREEADLHPAAADLDPAAEQAKAPPISEDYYPCTGCHEPDDVNYQRRELEEHTNVKLEHGSEERWCFDCHDAEARDRLRLAGGAPIEYSESYRLCGQCHGLKLRDWRRGVHGKRSGSWNGKKEYLLCVHCHNPHAPRFAPLPPKRAPDRPREIRL